MINRSVIAIAITFAGILGAQTPPKVQSGSCWRARPLAECQKWVVTEMSIEIPMLSTRIRGERYPGWEGTDIVTVPDFGTRVAFTFGGMANHGADRATGVTATVAADQPGVSGRIELRRRYWTDSTVGIDVSGGLTVREEAHVHWQKVAWNPGLTAGASLDAGSFGLLTRLEAVPTRGRIAASMLFGGRASGKPGVLALVGFGGLVLWALGAGYGEAT